MRSHLALHLNLAAQGRFTIGESASWFNALAATEKVVALHQLVVFIGQTNIAPTRKELESVRCALMSARDQAVTVSAESLHFALRMLADDAAAPPADVYQLLLTLFTRHDSRRRTTQCANGCTHWWHHLGQSPSRQLEETVA